MTNTIATPSVSNEVLYEVFWPRGARQTKVKPLGKRLDTLNGKTLAFLWDYIYRGDEVFALLEEGIKERFPDARFVSWREFGNIHGTGASERETIAALPTRFEELGVDAVICGMAC